MVRRSRLVSLLVALVCVALAAAVLEVGRTRPEQDLVRGRLGQPVAIGDGTATVEDVRVATKLTRTGAVIDTTPGLYVVVRVSLAADGVETTSLNEARLLADGDRVYDSYESLVGLRVPPGFVEQSDLVFEVDPTHLDDLTLELWQSEIVSGYQARLQVPLGITADNAEGWRAAGVDQTVEPDTQGTTRALP